ncbi:ferric-dicitrate binding protein FerR (iron transport regulator) [Spirosoma lacussanchae]|uniref:FecR family protein n=1 Tax=Spirosoma lacussanchae TaxID=1884249 RepID=UPI00110996D6|nr:FecR domain-containing protein [Spirosoma lacussanchae]
MEDIITKEVLFDYFSGRVSPLQKKSVETWLAEAGNREQYYQWLHEWELKHLQAGTNWQPAFDQLAQRVSLATSATPIRTPAGSVPVWERMSRGLGRVWAVAASVCVVVGLSGWLLRDQLLYRTEQTGFGEIKTLTLPDGSVVTLNANSSLRFPRVTFGPSIFGAGPRTVELTGEADFAVRHLPDHQRFVVQTPKGLVVTVLGTQFTVLSRERSTRVVLHSGRVALSLRQQQNRPSLTMRPGDLATLGPTGRLAIAPVRHPEALAAWKRHRFSFEQTSLREIADILHENYGLTVTIKDTQLASRTVSGSFPARDANEVLALVAELLQINYIRDNDRVLFTD